MSFLLPFVMFQQNSHLVKNVYADTFYKKDTKAANNTVQMFSD